MSICSSNLSLSLSLSLSLVPIVFMASCNPSKHVNYQILIKEKSHMKILTLDRPQKLNALLYSMIKQVKKISIAHEEDSNVKLVILKGKGRSFCAGADIVAVNHCINDGHWSLGAKIFKDLYTLNYMTATNTKPRVSFLDGIVMGSGAEISIHGHFRVATENSLCLSTLTELKISVVFAMPETKFGLFPDKGASYFLSRLPGFLGEYLGLTSATLDVAEILVCGLATHFVFSSRLPDLEEALIKEDTSDPDIVGSILDEFSQAVVLNEKIVYDRMDTINRCFSKTTVEDILSALKNEAMEGADEWTTETIQILEKASPVTLKISLRSIREGSYQSIDQCLIREYRMLCHVLQGEISNDFYEGSRAMSLDKDKNPKWEISKLEQISEEMVGHYFSKVNDEELEDLQLSASSRSNSLLIPVTAKL